MTYADQRQIGQFGASGLGGEFLQTIVEALAELFRTVVELEVDIESDVPETYRPRRLGPSVGGIDAIVSGVNV